MLSDSFKVGKYEMKNEHGVHWLKIFYHNCTGVVFFKNESEALNSNTEQKFSILGMINERYQIDDKFEFLLEYPELNKSNHWRQSNNPIYDRETGEFGPYNVTGYEPIDVQLNGFDWGGLVRSSSAHSFLDGSVGGGLWHYAIGQYRDDYGGGRIVATSNVNYVSLYIRIDESFFNNIDIYCAPTIYNPGNPNFIIITIFLTSIS